MGSTVTSIIIAVLAGIGTYYAWGRNTGLAMILAVVTAVAGLIGTISAFVWAVGFIFQLLPILLLILGIWLIWKVASSRDTTDSPR